MSGGTYLVAAIRPWNVRAFREQIAHFPGDWHLVTRPEELTVNLLEELRPRYAFFPHWSARVGDDVLERVECVGFHSGDLPRGRGGSPIQNLIAAGERETRISALRMTAELDAGPVYLDRPLSLEGLAEEIYLRAARTVAEMIGAIAEREPEPVAQEGDPTVLARRTPEESEVPPDTETLEALFDHVRMLDAEEYPRAFLACGRFRVELSRPALRTGRVEADARITLVEEPA